MTDKKRLTSTIGVLSALSFSIGAMASDQPNADPFDAETLSSGFMTTSVGFQEGSCGEGSCGEGDDKDKKDDKDEEGSCGEGSCGEEDDKDEEGACGEGTCGEA